MSTPISTSVQNFIQRLESLKDWPDKNVILELTAITEKNIGFAEHFANILMARLTNEQTHASYKLPMFYVIDAIMKHVGGPFANLFAVKFDEGYTRALLDLHQKDRDKLKFLLDTWDERSFMTFELIQKMKALLEAPGASRSAVQPAPHNIPVRHNAPMNVPVVPPPVYNRPKSVPAPVQAPAQAPAAAKFTPSDFRAPPADPSKLIFADVVQNEMVSMLNQMYTEMGVTNPMSLEELSRANASLYAQIRNKAEESAKVIISQRAVASPVVRALPTGRYAMSPTNSVTSGVSGAGGGVGGVGGYDDVTGRKRAAPAAGTRYPSADYNNAPNYQSYSSRFNSNPTNTNASAARYNQPYSSTTHDRRPNPTSTNINNDIHAAHTTSNTTSHTTSHTAEGNEEVLSKYASDYFVNGFLCEVPVVVDVARVQGLRDVLSSQYGTSGAVPKGFDVASQSVVERLDAYLNDVQVPPRLPQILFGPLPLRPIYAPSAEAVEEQNSKNKASANGNGGAASGGGKEKVQAKLPVPPFRTEELGRNPEAHIAALYNNRPHQFHEDGLRFATLALLTQHTDKFIQMKKLQQKRGAVREYREWYCTNAQWVTDFGSNSGNSSGNGSGGVGGVSGASSGGASGTAGVVSSSGVGGSGNASATNDNVEYVVQADEYFTRCPVSRETFECVWDEQEGEMLYRNAVKVLITPAADAGLYLLAQPIPWLDNNNTSSVRYMIVHKTLVLDAWLTSGKAVPLPDAITRYKAITTSTGGSGASGVEKAELLSRAVGEDDEEEDLFVLLEFV